LAKDTSQLEDDHHCKNEENEREQVDLAVHSVPLSNALASGHAG
jgi:hypothetical protein